MEDLKRVQEFFSKPLSEKLDLSNPEITDLGLQMHLINLNKELSYYLEKGEAADLSYAEMLKKDKHSSLFRGRNTLAYFEGETL